MIPKQWKYFGNIQSTDSEAVEIFLFLEPELQNLKSQNLEYHSAPSDVSLWRPKFHSIRWRCLEQSNRSQTGSA